MENLKDLTDKLEPKMMESNQNLIQIKKYYHELSDQIESRFKLNQILNEKTKHFNSDIIKFNVSGITISTFKSTITKRIKKEDGKGFYEPHLLEELYNESLDNDQEIPFIDRDPIYFNLILDYLRDPEDETVLSLSELNYKELLKEAKHYKLDDLIKRLENLVNFKEKKNEKNVREILNHITLFCI